ncbi:hypothetical protein M011DRAFT_484453 [Sporormia fimetaria CBS 119925]|uniref:Uncharacterized protein n=1 Tax=Sporormia fimetaria CBS 119925 TaxID=1340428 RepID=A0A6A6VGN0_9PLEO|nr:hypothetical protein M011DRAFT_484453 [Sporormia fimetaria CBS 119925]
MFGSICQTRLLIFKIRHRALLPFQRSPPSQPINTMPSTRLTMRSIRLLLPTLLYATPLNGGTSDSVVVGRGFSHDPVAVDLYIGDFYCLKKCIDETADYLDLRNWSIDDYCEMKFNKAYDWNVLYMDPCIDAKCNPARIGAISDHRKSFHREICQGKWG